MTTTVFGSPRRLAARLALLLSLALLATAPDAADGPDRLDLGRYRGQVVLVDFWASWCAPCRHSIPWLNEMQAKYAGRLVVVGVNVDRERAAAERFLRDVPARFEIVYDPEGALARRYDVPGMPTSFLFGPDGELVDRHIGFKIAARAEREAQLQKLLAARGVSAR